MDFEEKVMNTECSLNRGFFPSLWCDEKEYCTDDNQRAPDEKGDCFCFPWCDGFPLSFWGATDAGVVVPLEDDEHTESSKGMVVLQSIKDLLYNSYQFF
jgi:hypothetical protein